MVKKVKAWTELVLSLFLFFTAFQVYSYADHIHSVFLKNGTQISLIKSVGGQTLEESFYDKVGHIYSSFGSLTSLIGLIFSVLFIYLGVKSALKSFEYFSDLKLVNIKNKEK